MSNMRIDREESILDILLNDRAVKQLDKMLLSNVEYLKAEKNISFMMQQLRAMDFTREQKRLVNRLVEIYNEKEAVGEMLYYKRGMIDCVEFLKEVNIL